MDIYSNTALGLDTALGLENSFMTFLDPAHCGGRKEQAEASGLHEPGHAQIHRKCHIEIRLSSGRRT